jgi:RNA polymerase sigma factor (sigma-70 family)
MEFSELVKAIDQNDRPATNRILKKITPRLIRFLTVHMGAERQDAEDCAQLALLNAFEAIKDGSIRNADRIFSFLLTSCKNNYLNLIKKDRDYSLDDISFDQSQKPRQLLSMMDDERRRILELCLQQLSESYKTFIDFWFDYPDTDAKAAATHFGITVNNTWTRKHRILKKLSNCYQKKIKK